MCKLLIRNSAIVCEGASSIVQLPVLGYNNTGGIGEATQQPAYATHAQKMQVLVAL